jgi:hypothetical protein
LSTELAIIRGISVTSTAVLPAAIGVPAPFGPAPAIITPALAYRFSAPFPLTNSLLASCNSFAGPAGIEWLSSFGVRIQSSLSINGSVVVTGPVGVPSGPPLVSRLKLLCQA